MEATYHEIKADIDEVKASILEVKASSVEVKKQLLSASPNEKETLLRRLAALDERELVLLRERASLNKQRLVLLKRDSQAETGAGGGAAGFATGDADENPLQDVYACIRHLLTAWSRACHEGYTKLKVS